MKTIEKIHETKYWFLEKLEKINTSIVQWAKKKA